MPHSDEIVNACRFVSDILSDSRYKRVLRSFIFKRFAFWCLTCPTLLPRGDRVMEMVLMGACLRLFGLVVACLACGAATRGVDEIASAAPGLREEAVNAAVAPAHFFVEQAALPMEARNRVPIEALLLQLESHVRLEQAVAQSFLESPNSSLLHSRTISPLVN
jgi:hypothetical protein